MTTLSAHCRAVIWTCESESNPGAAFQYDIDAEKSTLDEAPAEIVGNVLQQAKTVAAGDVVTTTVNLESGALAIRARLEAV